ncbi:hypothetical protein [Sphingopyxis sp.]|uniref:hypothetical protein n=1 Tax=Sphingopyxis sp. TaxID=1908224 RepID=UPI003D132150
MKWILLFFCGALSSCTTPISREERLMDAIDREVRLPATARAIDEYARYYSHGAEGQVVAVFLLPLTPRETVTMDREMAAGKRRWMAKEADLPWISDGLCDQITVRYEIASERFLSVRCNGS